MADFYTWPADLRSKTETAMDAQFNQQKAELNAKFFKEADKNEDGQLNAAEWEAYSHMWLEYLGTKIGRKPPASADVIASGFEAYRISGNHGVTMEDLSIGQAWELEFYQSLYGKW